MSRRHAAKKRIILPDSKYGNLLVAKFINCVMKGGKKSIAERVVYGAFDNVKQNLNKDPVEVFDEAVKLVRPTVELRSRRVGGATYQVPVDVRDIRSIALALRWIIQSAKKRSESTMLKRIAAEIVDIMNGRGNALKKNEDTKKMAQANLAYAHYRW